MILPLGVHGMGGPLIKDGCWADKSQHQMTYGCDAPSTTDIGLCDQHYGGVVGARRGPDD